MSNRNRHKTQKLKPIISLQAIKKLGLENILGIISLLIASIALFFSWQANNLTKEANVISLKQISEQLVITKIIHLGGHEANTEGEVLEPDKGSYNLYNFKSDYLFCSHKIRLSNLGESATSVINFSVRASYTDEIAFLEGFGEAITFFKKGETFKSLPVKDIQSIIISEELANKTPLNEEWLNNSENGIDLPIAISGKSSLDFIVHSIVVLDRSDPILADNGLYIMYPYMTFTSEEIDDIEKTLESRRIYSFKMNYIFETATGQIINTNPLMCWSIGVFPNGTINSP